MNNFGKYLVMAFLLPFLAAASAVAADYSLSNLRGFPAAMGKDAAYNMNFNFTTPDNVEEVDVQLALKKPSEGYRPYGVVRKTIKSSIGYALFGRFLAENNPAVGGGYILEIKLLKTGQQGEGSPLLYRSIPVSVKETGFVINNIDIPEAIQPYDSYDITIDYSVDQYASGYITLNNANGDEVLRIDRFTFSNRQAQDSTTKSTTILDDPAPGQYTWNLVIEALDSDANDRVVLSKVINTQVYLEDQIKKISMDSEAIAPNLTREVAITYTATEQRDLLLELWSSKSQDYRVVRKTVPQGSGTVTMSLDIPGSINKANDYYWWTKIIPVGGQWWQFFNELGTDAVVGSIPAERGFFDYPLYYFDGETLTASGKYDDYVIKVGSNIADNQPGIYLKEGDSENYKEFLLNIKTGDLTETRKYSWRDEIEVNAHVNPYTDADTLVLYRRAINSLRYEMREAYDLGLRQLGETFEYLRAIELELAGTTDSYDSLTSYHFGYLFRFYDFEFKWRNPANHPDTIVLSTDGVTVGEETHVGFTIDARTTYGIDQDFISFDIETGIVTQTRTYQGEVKSFTEVKPPYTEGGSNVHDYLDLLKKVEAYLVKLATGTKVGDFYLALPYPQMAEYLGFVQDIIAQLEPLQLGGSDLYFGGDLSIVDYNFIAVGPGNHPTRWHANFSQNDAGEWILKTAMTPGFAVGNKHADLNLATGELHVIDQTQEPDVVYTVTPPLTDFNKDAYVQGLSILIENLKQVETLEVLFGLTRKKPQLKQVHEYFEAVKNSL